MTDKKENPQKEEVEKKVESTVKFTDFNFKKDLQKAIDDARYDTTTPVQELSIPIILGGYDLISQAQTGTGKTAAFGLPIIEMMDGKSGVETLIIVPTRELAMQVSDELWKFTRILGYKTTSVFGGSSYGKQIKFINGSSIVVATPGRLLDLLEKDAVNITPKFVVLDEADEMLNMGFIHDIRKIFNLISSERQTLMFSATMPDAIKKLAVEILNNPKEVKITPKNISNDNIEQYFYLVDANKKKEALLELLKTTKTKKTIIFCRTKVQTDRLNKFLKENKIKSLALHGDIEQWNRKEITKKFKSREFHYLVATDVAARGLDIKNVSHVINFDIPLDAEPYVHRIGRTGRAGEKGEAHTFVSLDEMEFLKNIQETVKSELIPAEITTNNRISDEELEEISKNILKSKTNRNTNKLFSILKKNENKDVLIEKLISYILTLNKSQNNKFTHSKEEAQSALENFIKVKKAGNSRRRNFGGKGGNRNSSRRKSSTGKKRFQREEKNYNWR